MKKTVLFSFAIQLLLLPAVHAGIDAGTALDLRLRSAETFFEAIAYELRKDPASRAALDKLSPGEIKVALEAKASAGNMTQAELFRETASLLPTGSAGPAAREKISRAIEAARVYLSPEDSPVWITAAAPAAQAAPADLLVHQKGSPETAAIDPGLVAWKDASGYAASRIGPLAALLDRLGAKDEIILSNLPLAALLPLLEPGEEISSLRLPISGYAKKLWLLEGSDGRRTLLLSDFQGRIYLRHFELLLKRYYSGKKAAAIKIIEAPSAYEPYYKALARLYDEKAGELSGLEGVIAGYGAAFQLYWSSWAVTSVSDGNDDWRLDVYRPAGAGRWAVLTARSSFYGETLGENIKYLVERSTGIRTVVIAGSGGSLEPRPLYDFTYPSHLITPGGREVPNALGSQADFRAHKSALSPLEETPAWLAAACGQGVSTVDVEMGPAAEILSGRGLRLGFAVMVTDFPLHSPAIDKILEKASLASQDAGAKYRNMQGYARGLEEWLLRGIPPGWQPVEKKLGRSLQDQSALNLKAQEGRLSPLSAGEEKLRGRLENFFRVSPPGFSVRMSQARAARVLGDEAFLSTELVSLLKGTSVSPFTPDYEQGSYRAWRYIFGTLSYWDGPEKYGDTVLRLKERVWRRRAWATRRSAMRALAIKAEEAGLSVEKAAEEPELVKKAEELFSSWIVTPGDLPRALALQLIGELRELPPGVFAEFQAVPDKEIPGLIARHDVGWLEGKIWEAAGAEDIEFVKTRGPAPEEILRPASGLGIKVLSGVYQGGSQ